MIKKCKVLVCLFLLCFQFIPFSFVYAETVEDTSTSATTDSTIPDDPLKANSRSEEQKQSMNSTIEVPVLNYEDQTLLEQEQLESVIPAILIEEKSLMKEIIFRGKVTAGAEKKGINHSATKMESLILQRSKDDAGWEDHYVFTVDEGGVNLSSTNYMIDFSETNEEPGLFKYRLIMDYTVEYFEEVKLLNSSKKKASLELGSVEAIGETLEAEQFEVSLAEPEETTSISNSISEEILVDSTEAQQTDEAEPLAPPPLEINLTNVSTKASSSELPELQDNYRHAFQRGMGIMPMASSAVTPTITGDSISNINNNFVEVEEPVIVSARYTSTTRVTMTLQLSWMYGNRTSSPISQAQATTQIDKIGYSFYTQMGGTYWGKSASRNITGLLNRGHLEMQSGGAGGANGNLTNDFTNTRRIAVEQSGSIYRYRSYNTTKMVFDNIPVGTAIKYIYSMSTPNGSGNYQCNYTFTAPNFIDLTAIATPTFTATNHVTNSVTMNRGRYTGDVDDVTTDGQFRRTNDAGAWLTPSSNLSHERARNGYYNSYAVTGLSPGTQYHAYVSLKDVFGTLKSSAQAIFYTPNSVNTPSVTARGTPSTVNDATATLEGTYNVGASKPAHPTASAENVWVQISTNGSTWTTVSPSTTINQSTKNVTYTLTGLAPKTTYWTRFAVKNLSNAWSSWGTVSFTTKGIALTIDTPTFDQVSASDTSITMNEGNYTGDIFQTNGQGRVEVTGNDGSASDLAASDLTHSLTRNGEYDTKTITGLKSGTRYQGTVAIKDSDGTLQYASNPSKWSDYFYTKNAVNQPNSPTLGTPSNMFGAKADFTATYEAGDNTGKYTPAHPNEIEVEISTDNAIWTTVSNTTSPQLTSSQLNSGTQTVDFSLEKLKANTTYYARYRVKNAGGWSAWSASREFTTLGLPPGLYITDFPTLDFGMLQKQVNNQTATLSTESVKNHVVVDNSNPTVGWSLSAKLETVTRVTDARQLSWATLRMKINLQNTTDAGTTWGNYTTGVIGTPRVITLNSGEAAQTLWQINNPADAQGTFRNQIDWNTVELDVPGGNHEGYYQGKLTWSLNSVP